MFLTKKELIWWNTLTVIFFQKYQNIKPKSDAKINTETVAWAIDRFSPCSKFNNMNQEVTREIYRRT